ncbi:hypothetical protein [Viridibacterium curvum]|uniref:Ceramidase n=1 Tax=Viridibacterium curvum TaxID=1101404 RepID=A0ABP9QRN3_9RHOO
MSLLDHIDNYCERTDPGLWAEPVNALSNLCFLIAAGLLWQQAENSAAPKCQRRFAALVALIGLCSGLFHFFGTVWSAVLDVGSITLFILAWLYQYQRRVEGFSARLAALGLAAFIVVDRLVAAIGSLGLNGSEGYLLPGALLIVLSLRQPGLRWLRVAACVFPLSLTLRSLDNALCDAWPIGTHWGWHALNGLVLYGCVRALFSARRAP